MRAAFFDVDKTVIARSSMVAFAPAFRHAGLLRRRTMLRGLWTQVLFVRFGAGAKKLARLQATVLAITRGWDQEEVRAIVSGQLVPVIDPVTYDRARRTIDDHRRAGDLVFLVSAAPAEVVGPLADHLGVDGAIASEAEVGPDGRYTGRMSRYVYGAAKAEVMVEVAARHGIDLSESWAYSDSFTDLPMLEAVGHPVAVNADRALRAEARRRGWELRRFDRPAPAAGASAPDAGGGGQDRSLRVPSRRWGLPLVATVAAATGGITAWRYLHRPTPAW